MTKRAVEPGRWRRLWEVVLDAVGGAEDQPWSRVVMRAEQERLVRALEPERLRVLEISGRNWRDFGFSSYRSLSYPAYDVCRGPLPETFDLVIADQVLEHVLWPHRAGRHLHAMVAPGGHALVSVPFLVRPHPAPHDCTRWSETGLKYFLAECGFRLWAIETGGWGNRACVEANLSHWVRYRRRFHSLRNDPAYPYHVWALARREEENASPSG